MSSVSNICRAEQGGLAVIVFDISGASETTIWQIPGRIASRVDPNPASVFPVRFQLSKVEKYLIQDVLAGLPMRYQQFTTKYVTPTEKDTILHLLNAIFSMTTIYPWSQRELRMMGLPEMMFIRKILDNVLVDSYEPYRDSSSISDPSEIFTLNKNNNGNANEDNDIQASKSRKGVSKSDETIGTKSRHSYQNKRRATNKQSRYAGKTRAQPKIEVPMKETQPRLTENQAVVPAPLMPFAPDSRTIYPPVLHNMLNSLAKYKTAADVPPVMKEQVFQFVFQSYLDGGCKHNAASISSDLQLDSVNLIPEPSPVAAVSQHVADSQHRDLVEQKKTPTSDNLPEVEDCTIESEKDRGTHSKKHHFRDCRSEKPLVFFKEFNEGEEDLPLNQAMRSLSFVSPGQLGHSDFFFDVNFLGQQDDNAMNVCYHYDPDNIPRGVTNHMEDIAEVDKHVDEVRSLSSKEPFTSDYVFRMVFGSSFIIPSHYWYIHPPVLPSRVVQIKVHEDGISDKVIGKGCFGQVIAATLRVYPGQSRDVVVKEHFMNRSTEGDIIKEARVAMHLESTGCVPICYGVLRDVVGNLSIVLELFGSGKTLHELLAERTLSREDWLDIVCQLAIGLNNIHNKGILINDLKPDNILVNLADSVPYVKFCDMGSASYKSGVIYEDGNMERFVHLAPEVRAHTETTEANDVYGLGRVIKKIHYASRISALLPLSEECMTQNPTDRLPLYLLSKQLTKMYRNELIFPSITVSCCGQLHFSYVESEADSDVELKSVSQEDETSCEVNHDPNKEEISKKLKDEIGNVELPAKAPHVICETHNDVFENTESDYASEISNREYERKVDCDCSIDVSPKLSPRTFAAHRTYNETSSVTNVKQSAPLPEFTTTEVQGRPSLYPPSEPRLSFSTRTRAKEGHASLCNQTDVVTIASGPVYTLSLPIYHAGMSFDVCQGRSISTECIVRAQTKLIMLAISTGSTSVSSAMVQNLPINPHHSSNWESVIYPGQSVSAITQVAACELSNTLTNTGTAVTPVVCCTIPNRIVPQSMSAETLINEVQLSSAEFHTPYASPILNATTHISSAFEPSAEYRTPFGSASPSSALPVSPTEFLSAAPSRSGTPVSYADFGTILGTVATSAVLEEPNVSYVPDDQDNSENEAEVYGIVVESAPELCLYLFIAVVLPVLLFCGIFGFV